MIENENRRSDIEIENKKDDALNKWRGGAPITGAIIGYLGGLITSYNSMLGGVDFIIFQIIMGIFWLLLSLIPMALGAGLGLLLGSIFGSINKLLYSNKVTISKNEEKKILFEKMNKTQILILTELRNNIEKYSLLDNYLVKQ